MTSEAAMTKPNSRHPWAVISLTGDGVVVAVFWYSSRKLCEAAITKFLTWSAQNVTAGTRTRANYAIARWCGKPK